jgi:hypothetical protein
MSSDEEIVGGDGIASSDDEAGVESVESADEPDAGGGGASRGHGKPKKGAKAKGKAKPAVQKKNLKATKPNKYSKTKDGKKYCRACGKHLPIGSFPEGSANCTNDKPAIQNLKTAAKNQGESAWFDETYGDEGKLQRAVSAYHRRCPKIVEGRRATKFKILRHIEEIRVEEQLLFDGVKQMMNEREFIVWMGKAKKWLHGSMRRQPGVQSPL